MSSSFSSRPQSLSGADPPPPQFCAKEVAASTWLAKRRKAVLKILLLSSRNKDRAEKPVENDGLN